MSKFTAAEKAREADREFRMRIQVYQRNGWYGPLYTKRLEMMKEMADEYALKAKEEVDANKPPDLFDSTPDPIDRV